MNIRKCSKLKYKISTFIEINNMLGVEGFRYRRHLLNQSIQLMQLIRSVSISAYHHRHVVL